VQRVEAVRPGRIREPAHDAQRHEVRHEPEVELVGAADESGEVAPDLASSITYRFRRSCIEPRRLAQTGS
jgi:hypothetical protein